MTARIDLSGVVGDDIQPATVKGFLAQHSGEPVEAHLNSPGGSVFAGVEIYNAIRDHGDTEVVVDGLAASAASLLAMGGKRVVMKPGALMMIHRASAMTLGNSAAHRKSADVLDGIDAEVVKIYSARTGMSRQRVEQLLDAESWFSGEEAVDAHLADHAEEVSFEMSGASACAPDFKVDIRNLYRNPPQALWALMAKEKDMTTPNPNTNPALPDATKAILAQVAAANLSAKDAVEIVAKANGDAEKAKSLIIDAVASASGDQTYNPAEPGTMSDPSFLGRQVEAVLYARMSGKQPEGAARELAGRSLLDLGAMLIQANGGKVKSWSRDRLAEQVMMEAGQHSTSDFPFLTAQAGNRILLDAYSAAESLLKQVARRRTAQDFRSIAVGRLGEMPALLEVPEGGEVKYGSRTESYEAFRLRTFGRIFAITRNALINDDLSAFTDSARAWGVAAATVEANELYSLIAGDGVVLSDNKTLWHVDHGNVAGSGSGLDLEGLSDGRLSIRNTKGLDGATPLSLAPKFLIVGPENETQAEKVLASIAAAKVEDVNAFSNKLTLLVEPRISDYAWFLFAAPEQAEVIAFANLGDRTGPELSTKEGWTVLGQEFRAILDFGAGATGFRGAYKNAGAEVVVE